MNRPLSNKNLIFALTLFALIPTSLVYSQQTRNNPKPSLHNTSTQWPLPPEILEKRLGWIKDLQSNTVCPGYYVDKPSQFPADLSKDTLYLHADHVVLSQKKPSIYTGNVVFAQPDSEMTADKAVTELNDEKNALKSIQAYGNVSLRQPGILVVANDAELILPKKASVLHNLVYRLSNQTSNTQNTFLSLPARGEANTFNKLTDDEYDLTQASYTTCAPNEESWFTTAKKMHIDNKKKIVTAHQTYFYVAGIPLFYTPYFNYSYDDTPKSGFLMPNVSNSSRAGIQFALPFYWYAAPNTTLLLTPSYWSTRGSNLTTTFDYLTWNSKGKFYFDILPHDPVFANFQKDNASSPIQPGGSRLQAASTARHYLSWQQQTLFNPYWSAKANLNYVSDDYYFQDFGANNLNQFTLNQLPQLASLEYRGARWNFAGILQNYQTLHPINTPFIPDQYARTPELISSATYPHQWAGLTYKLQSDFVNFTAPWFLNQPAAGQVPPITGFPATGQRLNLVPSISLPLSRNWGYITPQLQLQNTFYNLNGINNSDGVSTGVHTTIARHIPIFNIDSGLYFDKGFQFGKESYTQTLEPRLFYLYAPTVNQSDIPLFDTSAPLFTYDLIFQTNRFNGIDRISNANQIGLGVISRLIDDNTGFNRLTAKVGQIYYFENRQATLTKPSPNDSLFMSPIAGELNYYLNNAISITGNAAWNPNYNFLQNGILNLAYRPDTRHIFNIGATYQRVDALDPGISPINPNNNIKQLISSLYWPVSLKWNALASVSYNLQQQYAMNYFAGLEYDTCCWAMRFVASRNFIGATPNNTPMYNDIYYIQFLLKGLTALGTSQSNNLASTIPGFVDKMKA